MYQNSIMKSYEMGTVTMLLWWNKLLGLLNKLKINKDALLKSSDKFLEISQKSLQTAVRVTIYQLLLQISYFADCCLGK